MLFSKKLDIDKRLLVAIAFLLLSFALVFFGFDKSVSDYLQGLGIVGALMGGAFYTFGITTPFAMVVVLELMRGGNALIVAWFACLAATAVDCFFFILVRDALERNAKKLRGYFHSRFGGYSPAFPIAGFLVFGLPIPDEIGLALMEMTDIKIFRLALVIFCAKFITLLIFWKALAA
jgi:hypothetical protein